MDPSGKTILLTGATGGLGRAIAEILAEQGATLVLSSRKGDELEQLAASLPGSDHRTIVADLDVPGSVEPLLAETGELDVLVANAGLGGGRAVEQNDAAAISTVARVNYEVPMLLAAGVLDQMRECGSGSLVFISSLAAKAIPLGAALYASSKAGLRAFSLGLAGDLQGTGVTATAVCPGFIRDAGMFHDGGGKAPPGIGTATPEQVGAAVLEAIETGKREIEVAPLAQRVFVNGAYHLHGPFKRLERAVGRPLDE